MPPSSSWMSLSLPFSCVVGSVLGAPGSSATQTAHMDHSQHEPSTHHSHTLPRHAYFTACMPQALRIITQHNSLNAPAAAPLSLSASAQVHGGQVQLRPHLQIRTRRGRPARRRRRRPQPAPPHRQRQDHDPTRPSHGRARHGTRPHGGWYGWRHGPRAYGWPRADGTEGFYRGQGPALPHAAV